VKQPASLLLALSHSKPSPTFLDHSGWEAEH
jgi:hypothetical protein